MAQNNPNCTNTLLRTITVAQNFTRNAPLTFPGTNDPAFLIGDWVRQFILGPPFAWRWNRAVTSTTIAPGTQDYQLNIPAFGWLEHASVYDSATTNSYQLEIRLDIAKESTQNQPRMVSAQFDDDNGNITFRVFPVPEKAYVLDLSYQIASPRFANINDTWAPIPDFLSYLYNQGLLAKTYEYLGDPRFGIAMPLFVRQVIAANAGLDDTQLNIFLGERMNTARESQTTGQLAQVSVTGRGMF